MYKYYKRHFSEDTYKWFWLLVFKESTEILFQVIALHYYNGFNLIGNSQTYLAYGENEILVFAILLGMNCIVFGILWIFYFFCHKICFGIFYKQVIFIADSFFDAFYALYPIIVVANRTGYDNLHIAVGVFQFTSLYVTIYSILMSFLYVYCLFIVDVLCLLLFFAMC